MNYSIVLVKPVVEQAKIEIGPIVKWFVTSFVTKIPLVVEHLWIGLHCNWGMTEMLNIQRQGRNVVNVLADGEFQWRHVFPFSSTDTCFCLPLQFMREMNEW